ncbi:hypothetical protein TW95_gp0807 [Pandoravirus inopinatum]|uniref:Uncharacterized protein n=1 Tax=Pandoravirus inopinatum TaxID=1605721 RepID=A0A0B5J9I9_9VIRU|nr:hypothetical protein TW95_gp0807 [Pandoravirus inopinatum]AJF97541.1 hypothetical protein [Pandoravirus inopinatum]
MWSWPATAHFARLFLFLSAPADPLFLAPLAGGWPKKKIQHKTNTWGVCVLGRTLVFYARSTRGMYSAGSPLFLLPGGPTPMHDPIGRGLLVCRQYFVPMPFL